MSSEVAVKRTLAKQVEERVRECRCLVCDDLAVRRGLCMKHYHTFLRRAKSRSDAAEFEAACIREGKILPVGKMRELKQDDPFSSVQ